MFEHPKLLPSLFPEHKHSKKRCPQVIGLKRIYIQNRPEKRLSFTIGGRAYLLPKTTVIIKCPVRHFPKAQIRWEKDGDELTSSKRLSITKSGALRIYNLEAEDIGAYRCWANQDSDTFILKLIGYNNRLLDHPALGKEGRGNFHPYLNKEGGFVHSKCNEGFANGNKASKSSWMQKNEFYRDDDGHTKEMLWDTLALGNYALASGARSHIGAFILEPTQFEELVKNISQLAESGDVTDEMASQLIGKLIEDLAAAGQGQVPIEESTRMDNYLDRTPNTSELFGAEVSKKAAIVRQKHHGSVMSFQRDLRIHVGRTAYLTNATHSLTLLCPSKGLPKPKLSWTKDGAPLQNGNR